MKNYMRIMVIVLAFFIIIGYSQSAEAVVKLNKKTATVTVGKTITLSVKGTKKKVKWSSSNKKIAKVTSKGKVKGLKPGKVTIKATIGKKTYKCKVTVKKPVAKKKTPTKTTQEKTTATKTTEAKPTEAITEVRTTEATTERLTAEITTEVPTTETITTEALTTEISTTEALTTELPTTEAITTEVPTSEVPTTELLTTEATTEVLTTEESAENSTPSAETLRYDAGEYSIQASHTGEGTFYDREDGGAANLDYLEASYYTVAMNNEDYMNGLAGAYIEITDKDGDKIKAVVTDRLPEGAKGDVDLTRRTFEQIEPLVTGRMNITWKIIPFPTAEPISYVFKPTSSPYWAEVQVRNGRYPIKKLEYYNTSTGQYVELERQEYNYFTAISGMGQGPYKFRVTDFYGHVLVDDGIYMNATSTPVLGRENFPY